MKDSHPSETGPLLLIIDDDVELLQLLAIEGAAWGVRVNVAESIAAARKMVELESPDVVLLDLGFPDPNERGIPFLAELTIRVPHVPVLIFTVRADFADRIEAVRHGASAFLQKPVPPDLIMEVVIQALERARTHATCVLAVDDDPIVLAVLQKLLLSQGISVSTLDDPRQFWDKLEESSPDLLLLDLDMPHVHGIELCRVVRSDPRWHQLPVVFLTAHTGPEIIRQVFEAGADDYLTKPIVDSELIVRIQNRLERARLQRSLAETDPLTAVANRRKSVQLLIPLMRLAARHGQAFSLAVLDLDHFKQVNDRFGHSVGDAVLRRLGEVLRRRFRTEDVVARWGGEEFVLGMHGMSSREGVRRLTVLVEAFQKEEFTGPDGSTFRVSFSAGVAEFPTDGSDLQSLYRAADGALYAAKRAGRARVLPASA